MAVAIANQQENHRGVYWEVTGDGATATFSVNHNRCSRPAHTVKVTGVTAPGSRSTNSGRGGLIFPDSGTAVTVSASSLSARAISVTTSPAIGNGTKACFVAVFDQYTD